MMIAKWFNSSSALKKWTWLHKWSSLVCTLFMLMLCITGLPLIFFHEIAEATGTIVSAPNMAVDAPRANLDQVLAVAQSRYPDKKPMFVSQDEEDDRAWFITLANPTVPVSGYKQVAVDARTSQVLNEPPLEGGFMNIMLSLHVDLFAGLPGMIFLGVMGILFVISLVSGVVLYAPFMRKLAFGEIRQHLSTKTRRLDLHNFLGILTLAWCLIVGTTGAINSFGDLLVDHWKEDQLASMIAPYKGKPAPAKLGSFDAAMKSALAAEPNLALQFVAFPGTTFSSPYHYTFFMRGNEAFSKRLLKPVLVDASTSQLTDTRTLPWYFYVLKISQPLHFGDYGGLPMKILWALLDLLLIVVLISGLYLWVVKYRSQSRKVIPCAP
ncbi:PepSY domain-containing protein [Leeia sp. TBRC 13508]|uniref:PepSY domain-containing protein n=1 Tax=Leeia speluncae TaxID=2884804 RepID=A0ABS8D7H0_9NEIS|nr:PepSY domain-containing protein [Leeia speluncae]MCB6183926.1 PepSY domain-containing protein [Leeia speluncae]